MNSARYPSLALALAASSLGWTLFAAELPRTSDFDYESPAPGSYTLPVVKPAGDGDVID